LLMVPNESPLRYSFTMFIFIHIKHITYVHLYVVCDPLVAPENGNIDCLLGDDGNANIGDTCSFTCNAGFGLHGSTMRECQPQHGEGTSWSGSEASCEVGMHRMFYEVTIFTTPLFSCLYVYKYIYVQIYEPFKTEFITTLIL